MKKLLALVMVALMATPAFAAVQNVKVSGDIDSTFISRNHFNLGTKGADGVETLLSNQNVFITQTRLRVDADLSDNVSTTVALINERAWDAEAAGAGTANEIDLNLAYVTLREMLYSPLTVTIGRQIFAYGNGLIIGDGGVNNTASGPLTAIAADLTKRTAYDGIKAVLDYKPLTLDLIAFKNQENIATGAIDQNDDSDVYGLNANYQLGDAMNTVVEGYLFARLNGDNNSVRTTKGDKLYVPGLRVSTNPVKGLNTQAELAWQRGSKATVGATNDNITREAMAAQFTSSYELPVLEQYKPVASASYTFVSGDKNSGIARDLGNAASGETYGAWDPLNEAQGSGTIYNTLFDLTNMNIIAVGLQATPIEDVTAKFTWSNLRSAAKYSAQNTLTLRQPDRTATTTATTVADKKNIGNEYDVNLTYAYTEDVKFGLNLGWFVPGTVFAAGNDSTASQALANVVVAF